MSDRQPFFDSLKTEFARLGLDWRDLPGLAIAGGPDGEAAFLKRLQELSPGVTWHTILPDLPSHWIPGKPATWTEPYRPLGAYDYPKLPTSPAVMISWARETDRSCLATLVAEARAAGFKIFGAGFRDVPMPDWPTLDAFVVFARRVSSVHVDDFYAWVSQRQDVVQQLFYRSGREKYAPQ